MKKKVTFKLMQQNFQKVSIWKDDHKIIKVAQDKDDFTFVIVDTRLQVVDYLVKYSKKVDSFTKVIGCFEPVSETTFYWLNQLLTKI